MRSAYIQSKNVFQAHKDFQEGRKDFPQQFSWLYSPFSYRPTLTTRMCFASHHSSLNLFFFGKKGFWCCYSPLGEKLRGRLPPHQLNDVGTARRKVILKLFFLFFLHHGISQIPFFSFLAENYYTIFLLKRSNLYFRPLGTIH